MLLLAYSGGCQGYKVSKETGAALVGVLQDNLVLSTGLIMWIGHHKEIQKLTFQKLALRQNKSYTDSIW